MDKSQCRRSSEYYASSITVAVYTQLEVGTQRPFQDIEEEELSD